MAKEEKGKTNMVKLRNTAGPNDPNGRLVMRSRTATRDDGKHISRPVKSNPGKTAWYNGGNRAVRLYAMGNLDAVPPVKPMLEPVDAAGKEWLKDVFAEEARIEAELAEE